MPQAAPEALVEAESTTVYAADGSVLTVLHADQNRRSIPLAATWWPCRNRRRR